MDSPIRILAVDDSVTIRKALELILLPAGYHVEFAVNGTEALAKARDLQPDIVLLDFILPDMRGTEVCRELLADPQTRSLPVVLISARGAEIRQAYNDVENVIDYLTKPFTPDAVLTVINEVLGSRQSRSMAEGVDATAAATAAPPTAAEPRATAESEAIESATAADDEAEWAAESAADAAPPPPARQSDTAAPPVLPRPLSRAPGAEVAGDDRGRTPAAGVEVEAMFEMLRAGLEGVYVEETHAAVTADRARSYTELASNLARQLGETLEHAESRRRFRLYDDGSLRALDEALLDTYRRVCRLLFRAVAAGAVGGEAADGPRRRLLLVCPRDSDCHEQLAALAADPAEAEAFLVDSDFRQLPGLARLFGPTHLIVDAGRGAAVADQIALLRALPEMRRLEVVAIVRPAEAAATAIPADVTFAAGAGLHEALRRHLEPVAAAEAEAPLPARAAGA